jgi:membrane-associated protease RseP (regulator of RpoE activity)
VRDPLEEAGVETSRPVATGIFVAVLAGLVGLAVFSPHSRTFLWVILGIFGLVMLHEAGHFIAARRCGMKATEFFVGFGPRLWSFRRGETEYGVKALPLGGYVKIVGMTNLDQIDPVDEPRAFRNGPPSKRMIVILAGVAVNLVLAFALIWAALAGRGWVIDQPERPTATIASIVGGSAASDAGLRSGDRIVAIGGVPVGGWNEIKRAVVPRPGEPTTITVVRDGRTVDLDATLGTRAGAGFLGVSPEVATTPVGALDAVPETFSQVGLVLKGTASSLGNRFSPSGVEKLADDLANDSPKGAVDENRPMSVIGIVHVGGTAVEGDLWGLLFLLGVVSFALAIFNLIPLIPLDGGHAAVVVYESIASRIRGRRVQADYRKLTPVAVVTLLLLVMIALPAMILDVRDLGR